MIENQAFIEKQVLIEGRLTRAEASNVYVQDELKDIKNTLRWLTGLVFSMNSTILAIITKGFGLLG